MRDDLGFPKDHPNYKWWRAGRIIGALLMGIITFVVVVVCVALMGPLPLF